jgi:hypothetical protein
MLRYFLKPLNISTDIIILHMRCRLKITISNLADSENVKPLGQLKGMLCI